MELIEKALEYEKRKMRFPTTSDRIMAAREAKDLILSLNEVFKKKQGPEHHGHHEAAYGNKAKNREAFKGKTFNIIKIQFYIAFLTFIFIFEKYRI